jgi:hypothetical protein
MWGGLVCSSRLKEMGMNNLMAMVITYESLALLNAQLSNKQPMKCTHLDISLKLNHYTLAVSHYSRINYPNLLCMYGLTTTFQNTSVTD